MKTNNFIYQVVLTLLVFLMLFNIALFILDILNLEIVITKI